MRKICICMMVISMMTMLVRPVTAGEIHVELPLRIVVDGQKVEFPDAQPFIDENNRTQVPVRFVSEALGGKVNWKQETKSVTIQGNGRNINLSIGSQEYQVNGKIKHMDTVALLQEDRTYVPIRFVSEALGAEVFWEEQVRTAYINPGEAMVDDSETRIVSDFVVPKDIILSVVEPSNQEYAHAWFMIHFSRPNVKQQIQDLEDILLQKCDPSTVEEVIKHVKKKTNEDYVLPKKYVYDETTGRYIWIKESDYREINIYYLPSSEKKGLDERE